MEGNALKEAINKESIAVNKHDSHMLSSSPKRPLETGKDTPEIKETSEEMEAEAVEAFNSDSNTKDQKEGEDEDEMAFD